MWGGASTVIIPAARGATELDNVWQRFLDLAVVDVALDRQIAPALADRIDKASPPQFMGGMRASLLPTLIAMKDDVRQWSAVSVPRLEPSNPWAVAYLGALGHWPESPDTNGFDQLDLRTDLAFDEVLKCSFVDVQQPGSKDLLDRLRDGRTLSPVFASMAKLEVKRMAGTIVSSNGILPEKGTVAKAVGPSVVILYRPGSVEDLCLLWNLRWCAGLPYGAPLALPVHDGIVNDLRLLMKEMAIFSLNLSGSYFALTSRSVSTDDLQAIVDEARSPWRVEPPEELFTPSDRPTRTSSDVAVFKDGQARLPSWHPIDRETFGSSARLEVLMRPIVRFELEGQKLPNFSLDGFYSLEAACQGGGLDMPARGPTDTSVIVWPTGWEVLQGVASQRGLVVTPSSSGRIASGFVQALGSINQLRPLLSPQVLSILYKLAERRGTSRFKRQMRDLASAVAKSIESPQDQLDRIESRLAELSLPGSEEERSHVTFDEIRGALGNREAARSWLRWAEKSKLVLRGLPLKCERCRRSDWRPLTDIAPPWNCRWCGGLIERPFPENQVTFGYAASSRTLSLVGEDAITHLLALRWFDDLFGGSSGRKGLIGAFPGVNVRPADADEDIGEADVLLLFSDGSLVPGECKLRSSGWNDEEARKLEALSELLQAPWTFIATPQLANDCNEVWKNAALNGERPRYVLTGEQLFDLSVTWPLGHNPFSWRADNVDDREAHQTTFSDRLPDLVDRLLAERT